MIQQTWAVWSLIPLPFQNPACTSGSSQFMYCWSLSSVHSDSLWPHGLQHSRLPCPSPTPRAYSNSCSLSQWCHPTISSSVISCSSCLHFFSSIRVFSNESVLHIRWPSIRVSASPFVLPMNIQDWSPLGLIGWISLQSKGLSRVFSNITLQKINSSALSFLHSPTLTSIHDHWKNHSLD